MGLRSMALPPEVLERMVSEDDFYAAFENSNTHAAPIQDDARGIAMHNFFVYL